MSLAMLKTSYENGVRNIILTPHFRLGMFETHGDRIRAQYEKLHDAAAEALPDLSLYLGCEFHATMEQENLLSNPRFFMAGSRNLLLEFSGGDTETFIRDRVRSAQMLGAKPIIAHVERIRAITESQEKRGLFGRSGEPNLDFIRELRKLGARIQVNADAVLGFDGRAAKNFTKTLLKEDLVDFIGSDAHNLTDRPTNLGACADFVAKKYSSDTAERIFIHNPSRLP